MKTKRMTTAKKARRAPLVPFQREPVAEKAKHEVLTFKLRTDPADAGSTMYELTVPLFNTGSCEEFLEFLTKVDQVIAGQALGNGPARYVLARRLLQGDALAAFNLAANANGAETQAHFVTTMRDLI